ncbi:Mechanosensitive ion channel-domain-containing protein [Ephemerocybe angulata]|uniref:Mechanosensitive ion channel-domain-containing protein n=1 Tax=Ephemerocybe angulata TaxID=980116 RepID=A0A8H6I8Y4_9AGAR|nr:Mechanosensitive ion channel-domain-containing protein [Tulosesus angulatus]
MSSKKPDPLQVPQTPLHIDTELDPNITKQVQDHYSDSDTSTTNESTEVEFDWDHDEEAQEKAEHLIQATRGRAVWLAFMKLSRPFRVTLVALLGVAILITPLIIVNVRFRDNPAKIHVHVWSLWLTIDWASSCGTYILVDSIPHLVIALTSLFGGQVERLKIQLELVMAVKGWLKLALDIVWAWVALSVIRAVYQPPGSYWSIINQVVQAMFAASMIILAEKLFLHFVAITFHQQALADRLAENRLGLRALDHLSRSPYNRKGQQGGGRQQTFNGSFDMSNNGGHKRGPSYPPTPSPHHNKAANKSTASVFSPKRRNRKNVANVIVDQVGGAIGQVALKNSKFNKDVDLIGLGSARRLARKLFAALSNVYPPRSHLVVEDFYPYFRSTAEAHEAFAIFDKDGNGDISRQEMREAVQRIYRERKALVHGLKDVGSIVAKLDAVCMVCALLIILFICLLIFKKSNTLSSLVPLATIVLGFSFIFGNSAQTLFESLIFIFSTHVFDVGDLVMIDDQVLTVQEFGLFSTTFKRVDGQFIIAPNSLLANTKLVHNLRRSKSMWESTTLTVSYNTSIELIEQLKGKISDYISANNREWSGFGLNIDKMEYQNALHLVVAMEHRPNWQDWGGRWTRRNAFMRYLKTVLEELDIRYTMPVQPVILPSANGRPPMTNNLPSRTPSSRTAGSSAQRPYTGDFQPGPFSQAQGPSFSKPPTFAAGERGWGM